MMSRIECLVHGNFTTERAVGGYCPRCADMERNSIKDLYAPGSIVEYISKTGVKHDQEKPDLSLLPKEFLEEVSKAFMHGEKKYGRYNFINGMEWHRVIAASLRHITSFNAGENVDAESGLSHLSHAGACIAMLLVYTSKGLGTDTRYKK